MMNDNLSISNLSHTEVYSMLQHIPGVANILLTVITLWAIVSLIHYGHMSGKWRHMNQSSAEKLNHGLIYTSVVICAVLCELRFISTQITLGLGIWEEATEPGCEITGHFGLVMFNLAFFMSLMVLWLRQRVFYLNQMLNVTYGRCVSLVSKYCIWILLLLTLTATCIHISLRSSYQDYSGDPGGCLHEVDSGPHTSSVVLITLTFVVGELTLIGLFLYPLKMRLRHSVLMKFSKRYRTQRKISVKAVSVSSEEVMERVTSAERPDTSTNCDSYLSTANEEFSQRDNLFSQICTRSKTSTSQPSSNALPCQISVSAIRKPQKRKKQSLKREIQAILQRSVVVLIVSIVSVISVTFSTFLLMHSKDFRRLVLVITNLCLFFHFLYIVCAFSHWKEMLLSSLLPSAMSSAGEVKAITVECALP